MRRRHEGDRERRARGSAFVDAVLALTIAVTFAGVFAEAIASQGALLHAAHEDAVAREELLSAYERLRAGAPLPAPRGGVTITVERVAANERLVGQTPAGGSALVALRLHARWRAVDGKPRERSLDALVLERAP
jgi:hypothetical protein